MVTANDVKRLRKGIVDNELYLEDIKERISALPFVYEINLRYL